MPREATPPALLTITSASPSTASPTPAADDEHPAAAQGQRAGDGPADAAASADTTASLLIVSSVIRVRLPGLVLAGSSLGCSGVAGAGRILVMTDNTPPPQVWPTLRARDARALIRFLVDAFGFEETAVYGEGDIVHHAQLSWPPGGGVMLGSADRPGAEDSWPLPPGGFGAYVVTDDPDALFARATAAGAEIVSELHETDYGSRDFAVRDPEGNRWSFGTYRGEPRKG